MTGTGLSVDANYVAKPKLEVSKFKGNFSTFITWQTNFENTLSGARVPESKWVWLMNQNMETGTTAQRMMNDYTESEALYNEIVTAFSRYFAKLNKTGVEQNLPTERRRSHHILPLFQTSCCTHGQIWLRSG